MTSVQTVPRMAFPLSEDEAYELAQGIDSQAQRLRLLAESEEGNGLRASAEWTRQRIAMCEALAIRLRRVC